MRFTAATVAFFVGLAAAMPNGADTTVYQTEEVTITSCGPEVTNCPARATSSVPSGAAATETSAMTTAVPTTPAGGAQPVSSSSAPVWSSAPSAPAVTSASSVVPVAPAVTPSVIAHTSCSTWYETVTPLRWWCWLRSLRLLPRRLRLWLRCSPRSLLLQELGVS